MLLGNFHPHFFLCFAIIDGSIADLEEPITKCDVRVFDSHVFGQCKLNNAVVQRARLKTGGHSFPPFPLFHNWGGFALDHPRKEQPFLPTEVCSPLRPSKVFPQQQHCIGEH